MPALKAPIEVIFSEMVSWSRAPEAVPHSKETLAKLLSPRLSRLPFKVAELSVTSLAALLVTTGSKRPVPPLSAAAVRPPMPRTLLNSTAIIIIMLMAALICFNIIIFQMKLLWHNGVLIYWQAHLFMQACSRQRLLRQPNEVDACCTS